MSFFRKPSLVKIPNISNQTETFVSYRCNLAKYRSMGVDVKLFPAVYNPVKISSIEKT